MTEALLSLFYRATVDPASGEPRRLFFFSLYYVIGFAVIFIVFTMVLLCLEAYHLTAPREWIYRKLGPDMLAALESLLF